MIALRSVRPKLRRAGRLTAVGGIALALVSFQVFESSSPYWSLFGFPIGVTIAFIGWFVVVGAAPLEHPLRRRDRQLRLFGATACAVSAGLITVAELFEFGEVHIPTPLYWSATAAVGVFPVGLALVVVFGPALSLWGRREEWPSRGERRAMAHSRREAPQ
jgi:hypothetical protein